MPWHAACCLAVMVGRLALGALGVVLVWSAPALAQGPELRPGMALPPEFVSPEAAAYEAQLDPNAEPDAIDRTRVVKRRHFDDRHLFLGVGVGEGSAVGILGVYLELAVIDRLTLGAGVGLTFWGRAEGGYLRGRPVVWGGAHEKGVLHALTLQFGYTHMEYGRAVFSDFGFVCLHGADEKPGDPCYRSFVDSQPAHFGLIQAGFEHSFSGGLSLHYELGVMHSLTELSWTCAHLGSPVACEPHQIPPNTTWVLSAGLSYGVL
jgi:hypothetical protein